LTRDTVPVESDHPESPPAERPAPPLPLQSWLANQLDIHGGVLLILCGFGLIALACVFASKPAVAPIFAAFGCVLVILGAFYSRIEGRLQAGRQGVSLLVREAQRLSIERGDPPEVTAEVVEKAADIGASGRATDVYLDSNVLLALASGSEGYKARERDMIPPVIAWLRSNGFPNVELEVPVGQRIVDIVARNDDDVLMVEVTASKRGAEQAIGRVLLFADPPEVGGRRVRRAVVIPATVAIDADAIGRAKVTGVEVYELHSDGSVRQVV
jgi:hypothetical protein